MNSQAVGLDIGLSFIKWLTGAENLHYGIWTDLEVTAGNLGQAQSVYTENCFRIYHRGHCAFWMWAAVRVKPRAN